MQNMNPCVDQLCCAFISMLDICAANESSVLPWFSVMSWYVETKHDISIILTGYVEDTFTITLQVLPSESLLVFYF